MDNEITIQIINTIESMNRVIDGQQVIIEIMLSRIEKLEEAK